jgi:putative transposase
MKASKFSEAQIAFVLKQAEDGRAIGDVCRKAGISEATFYSWRKKYAGLMASEMKRLRRLGDENGKLKKLVADLSLDGAMLQAYWRRSRRPTTTRAGALGRRRFFHRMNEIAATRVRYEGYRRIRVLLRREGWPVNAKRVYRLIATWACNFATNRPGGGSKPNSARIASRRPDPTRSGRWASCTINWPPRRSNGRLPGQLPKAIRG